VLSDPISL